jgi:hypothetical protein
MYHQHFRYEETGPGPSEIMDMLVVTLKAPLQGTGLTLLVGEETVVPWAALSMSNSRPRTRASVELELLGAAMGERWRMSSEVQYPRACAGAESGAREH